MDHNVVFWEEVGSDSVYGSSSVFAKVMETLIGVVA